MLRHMWSAYHLATDQAGTPGAEAQTDSLTCAEMARTPPFPQAEPKCMRMYITRRACAKHLPLLAEGVSAAQAGESP